MPTLAQATRPIDTGVYEPVARMEAPQVLPPVSSPPGANPFLRCPLPPVGGSVDSLRQFYRDGVPQARILTSAN